MSFGDLCFSFDFILDSRNALSLVAFNPDCLSAVRSHVHSHVEVIHVIFVHTFNGDRANLDNGGLQEVVLKLVLFVRTLVEVVPIAPVVISKRYSCNSQLSG